MKSFFRHLLLAAVLISFTSCKTQGPENMPPSVRDEACQFFKHNNVEIFWVPSSGAFADSTFKAVSTTAPSQMAMTLSRIMARGALKQVDLAVSGPNSSKVRRVLKDALKEQVTRLPKLYILYIGEPTELEELEKLTKELNVRFYYIAKPQTDLGGKAPK